jgi:hypothetical protein
MSPILEFQTTNLGPTGLHWTATEDGKRLSGARFFELLGEFPQAREATVECLKDVSMSAYVWETPVLNLEKPQPFECVFLPERMLEGTKASARAFATRLTGRSAVDFDNLGGDARLVVPCPNAASQPWAHLAEFVRHAPVSHVQALLELLGQVVLREARKGARFVSTSGLGVPWIHFRIDTRPKYYQWAPYRAP